MTIPNSISTFRLLLIPALWIFTFRDMPIVVAVGVLVAAFSDTLDGVLARRLGQVLVLDPELLSDHPHELLAAIILYAATVTIGIVKFRRFGNLHLYSGKIGSLLQYLFIVHALVTPGYSDILFFLAVGMFIFTNTEAILLQMTRSEVDEHLGSIFFTWWKRA
jgi:hypothetical protein